MQIVAVGDSFMLGKGDPEGLGWIGRLVAPWRRKEPFTLLYNLGIPGDTSADIKKRWRPEVAMRRMSRAEGRLVFSFGTNDCANGADGRRRVSSEDTVMNLTEILLKARAVAPTLMVGPFPIADAEINRRIGALDKLMGTVADQIGVRYLSLYRDLSTSMVWMKEVGRTDGAHPGADGYKFAAERVRAWRAVDTWRAHGAPVEA